jgi:integrase
MRIERSWDRVVGPVAPKSHAGIRNVPVARELRRYLIEHRLRSGRSTGLVFGRDGVHAFDPGMARERSRRAWTAAGLTPVTFHEARHISGSLMLDAGIPLTTVSKLLGHGSIVITADRYNHLVVDADQRAADKLDEYLSDASA